MTFGEKIKELRLAKKLTLKEVAEQAGLSIVSVNLYETGKVNPELTNLHKLAKGLGCKFEELYEVWKNQN